MSTNHSSNPHQVADRVAELGAQAGSAVSDVAVQAGKQLQVAAGRAEKLAQKYPWVAAGGLLGFGAIFGALIYRFLAPRPTVAELLGIDKLPAKAKRAASKYF